jgi:DNA polymerase-3 subunit alpha
LDLEHIPLNDPQTFALFVRGCLEGIFQFEGSGIIQVIKKLKPDCIEDLIAINALFRPGPFQQIDTYIAGKNDPKSVKYLHPLLVDILKSTFGVMVYQEQVMDIARICGGYSLGEADLLRRAMGKKKHDEMVKHTEKFVSGCAKNNISKEIAETLFNQMIEFSGYGFNKSHSAPYSIIGYQCAYLKTHYPAEFLVSCLNLEYDDSEKLVKYIYDLKTFGFAILPPCVNKSSALFTIEPNGVRFGLAAIKGLGVISGDHIKNHATYVNIYDFVNKNHKILNKKIWEALIYSGALDIFNIPKEILINSLSHIVKQEDLLEEYLPLGLLERCKLERQVLGFYLTHPSSLLRSTLSQMNCVKIKNLVSGICYIMCDIIVIKRKRNAQQIPYAFLQVSDETGIEDLAVFSQVLNSYNNLLTEGGLVVMKLQFDIKNGVRRSTLQEILTIDDFLLKHKHILKIFIKNKTQLMLLTQAIEAQKNPHGNTKILIYNNDVWIETDQSIIINDSIEFRSKLLHANIFLE